MSSLINIVLSLPFVDSSDAPVLTGTLTATPSSEFRMPGGGQAVQQPVHRAISNGSLVGTLQLADPSQTSPQGIGYTFTLRSGNTILAEYANVLLVADSNGNYDLAQLNTGQFVKAVPQTVISISGNVSGSSAPVVFPTGTNTISAYTMVAVANGIASTASCTNLADVGEVIGMAVAGAGPQSTVGVQSTGPITYNGWSWTSGLIFLSASGVPTQTPPSAGFFQVVGMALSPTSMLLSLQVPILIQ